MFEKRFYLEAAEIYREGRKNEREREREKEERVYERCLFDPLGRGN